MRHSGWEPVIGLEVHVQLATVSKLFCRCPVRFGDPPNTLVCPICTGQPGTLPALNGEALRLGALAGLVLGCTIDPSTKFDRKNYFYPDLPKGYQISQYDRPLCRDGRLEFEMPEGACHEVAIVRAHLEEDSGKIIHPEGLGRSLVDLNRAGTPLLEIVSSPDLHAPEQASAYLQELRRTLRAARVSECDMEKGGFRCDANVSLRPAGRRELGTRTEIKNLNSFRFVVQALSAEIERQADVLERGATVVQETMAFDPATGRTRAMRSKEHAHDYRYFPEPDLPAFAIDPAWVDTLRPLVPELPLLRQRRFARALGLPQQDAEALVADQELADYFEAALAVTDRPRETANWVLTEVLRRANERKLPPGGLALTPARLGELVNLVAEGLLSVQAGRQVAAALEARPDRSAREAAEELDLVQVSEDAALQRIVAGVLASEAELVARYRAGNRNLLNALLGAAMKASRGKANPKTVRALLERSLAT